MAQIYAVEVTLTGTAILLSTAITAFDHVCQIHIVPKPTNTHVVTVENGSSVVLKSIAKPSAADAILDQFDLVSSDGSNELPLSELAVNGTNAEKCTVFVVVR